MYIEDHLIFDRFCGLVEFLVMRRGFFILSSACLLLALIVCIMCTLLFSLQALSSLICLFVYLSEKYY